MINYYRTQVAILAISLTLSVVTLFILIGKITELETQAEKFTACEDYGMTTEATIIDKKRKIIRIACK